ncbi:MAG: hypothetical protein ACLFSQ_00245 [Candidatus Zixiibacteriota bacterium]
MRRMKYIFLFSLILICFGEPGTDDFTRISVEPFYEATGGAFAAKSFVELIPKASASNYNPALLDGQRSIMLSHSSVFDNLYIADFIAYGDRFSEKINWGISALVSGGDGLMVTALPDEEDSISMDNRPFILEEKSHYDFIINPSASYRLSDRTKAGITVRLFYRKIMDENAMGGGLSAGLSHSLSKKLNLGAYIRNLSTMPVIWSTGTNETALPSFRLGGVYRLAENENLTVEAAADGEYSLDEKIFDYGGGIRAQFIDRFSVLLGYGDKGFSAGAAAIFNGIGISASYSNQSELNNSYRIALFYRWN